MNRFDFKRPDLTAFTAKAEEMAVARKWTRIRFVICEGSPDAHTAWLVIEDQQFRLDGHYDTSAEAAFRCWQLAKALIRLGVRP